MSPIAIARLDLALRAAAIPIDGVSGTGLVFYKTSATTAQRTQGAAIVAAFDSSAAADAAALAAIAKADALAVANGQRLDALGRAFLALAQLVLDDRNATGGKVNAIGTALASPTSTNATVRTAVNSIPGGLVPIYTMQQFMDAIAANVNAAA